jgi:hypothetical protein
VYARVYERLRLYCVSKKKNWICTRDLCVLVQLILFYLQDGMFLGAVVSCTL